MSRHELTRKEEGKCIPKVGRTYPNTDPTTCNPYTTAWSDEPGGARGATHLGDEKVERDVQRERGGQADGDERAQRAEVGERVVVRCGLQELSLDHEETERGPGRTEGEVTRAACAPSPSQAATTASGTLLVSLKSTHLSAPRARHRDFFSAPESGGGGSMWGEARV